VALFIIVGLIWDWGGVKGHPGPGLSNFHHGQAFVGGFSAFAQTFVYAFFSFGGVELVAVAAGESENPYKSVPRAIKATFIRITLFYILTILTIGLCINYKDQTLLNAAYGAEGPTYVCDGGLKVLSYI
jgi:amino acid permease